jgi:hypothetical protein
LNNIHLFRQEVRVNGTLKPRFISNLLTNNILI